MTHRSTRSISRRKFLALGSCVGIVGCVEQIGESSSEAEQFEHSDPEPQELLTREFTVPLSYDFDDLIEHIVSGGVSQDGIPAIDEPYFITADAAENIESGDPVFGVVIQNRGEYPRL